jgi:hypothetical protein
MSAAHLMGLMYRYDKGDDLAQVIHDAEDAYYARFGVMPLYCGVHPGTVVPEVGTVDIVERVYIRANHILIGRFIEE